MTRNALRHARSEDGIALVVAIMLLAMMLTLALGTMTFVDAQSKRTGQQRQRETSFNIAEAALNAQITQISHHWSGANGQSGGGTSPTLGYLPCPGGAFCPSTTELTALVPGADSNTGVTWRTNVYDNTGSLANYYTDSLVGNQCGCDANGDGKIWVRAQATVRNKTRVVVSLVQQQMQAESVPHAAILAGGLSISNNGNHGSPVIDSGGGVVAVRCTVPQSAKNGTAAEDSNTPCMGQPLGVAPTKTEPSWTDLLNNQISGFPTHQEGYPEPSVFSQDQVDRFVNTAKAQATYYESCPASLAGKVVVINTTGECSYNGGSFNTQADPGFVLLLNSASSLYLNGNVTYYGVVYHENSGQPWTLGASPQSTGTLITVHGNADIVGGVIIDGPGRLDAGSSGNNNNIKFDDHGYDAVQSYAGAGIIQNSWREIRSGQ